MLDPEKLNPQGRDWPKDNQTYGKVLDEVFFERGAGPKRVAA